MPIIDLAARRHRRVERDSHDPRVPTGQQITLPDGAETFVRVGGRPDGAPTLLLHGLGATAALNWAQCFPELEQLGPVIAPDHRGHGRGARIGRHFRLEQCADDAAAILLALDAGPAMVVGYSMGGPIAQLLARRHPELVSGLILSATARDFRGAPADRLRYAALAAIAPAAHLIPPFGLLPAPSLPGPLRRLSSATSEIRRHEAPAVLAAARELGRFTSRSWVHHLTVPTAVLVHTDDGVVPPRRQHKLAAAMPDAHTIEVDGDHLAITNDPDRYIPALLEAHESVTRRTVTATAA
ncbi:MAG TPA: alpha/beta hydrolase [Acidimicrobiales bacterium]|nr:alpha/beta hydrolase [Acidimicrobiales bacterium]